MDTLCRRILRALEAVHRGFWLGLLEPDALDEATLAMYSRSASYREDGWNLSGFHHWEHEIVDRYFGSARRVLVTAAGGGREVIALARRGIHADGFEPDASFVAAGQATIRELQLGASLSVCPPSRSPELASMYDGAVLGWASYTHTAGRQARIDFLRGLSMHLQPGSPLLMSFFARGEHDRALSLTRAVARVSSLLRPGREPVILGDNLMVGYFHHFDRSDIEAEMRAAGLELLHFSRHPFGHAVARVPAAGSDGA
jgi:hypothetical protein